MKLSSLQSGVWRQLFIAIGILLVLIVGQTWIWGYVRSGAETLHTRRTEEQQLAELQQRLASIEAKRQEQLPLLDQLVVVFPRASDTSQVVDRLEQLADQQALRLVIQNIGTEASTTKTNQGLIPKVVTLRVEGTVPKLLQYIDGVEHIQEVAKVRSWSLNLLAVPSTTPVPGQPVVIQSPTNVLYQMTMNIVFYFQSQ